MTTCKNCRAQADGKFCSNCGQKTEIHRVTVGHVVHEFIHAITHADKGFLLTAVQLLTRPGFVALEYIEGKRKKYFNPLSFLVILSAIHAYVTYKAGYFQTLAGVNPRTPPFWKEIFAVMIEYNKLLLLLIMVPAIAFASFALFRKGKRNYAENFVLASYLTGEMMIFRMFIGLPLFFLLDNVSRVDNIFHIITFVYFVVAMRQFFAQNIFLTILKVVILTVMYIALYWAGIAAIVFVRNLILN